MANKLEVVNVDPKLRDFRNFLYLVWDYLNLPPPTPVQYEIAHWLQHGDRRRGVEAFRGVGKSWITCAYAVWCLLMDPQEKIEVISASKNLSDNFSTFCLQLINGMPILAHLKPRSDQRNSKIQFDVGPARDSKDPSIKSVGITGQITGTRATKIIADDIEVPNNSHTQQARDRLSELVKEFDAILSPGGDIIFLGTPQTEMSLYNELPNRGYVFRIWTAKYSSEAQILGYGSKLCPKIAQEVAEDPKLEGRSVDSLRFDDEDLAERLASYGRSGFMLQFMLDTSLSDSDRYPLKLPELIVTNIDPDVAPEKIVYGKSPELAWDNSVPNVGFNGDRYYRPMETLGSWIPYQGSIMSIDPSGRGKDEMGYCIAKLLNGYVYIPECRGLQGGYDEEVLIHLAKAAKKHKVNKIIIESNFGDGMFAKLLTPVLNKIYPCALEEVRHSKQKELRIIDTLEPIINRHRLVIDPKVITDDFESVQKYPVEQQLRYQLMYQMSRITKDRGALKQDDRLDALAIAVAYWIEYMSQDEDKQMDNRKAELMEKELRKFIENASGRTQGKDYNSFF